MGSGVEGLGLVGNMEKVYRAYVGILFFFPHKPPVRLGRCGC